MLAPTRPAEPHPGHRTTAAAIGHRPPDLIDAETDVAVWSIRPAGVLTSLGSVTRVTLPVARFLTHEAHAFSVRAHGKHTALYALHDWSALAGYDPDARAYLVEWCLAHRNDFAYSAVVRPPVNALLDMAITVASTTLRLARVPFDVSTSLAEIVQKKGIRPASSASCPPPPRAPFA